MTADDAHQSRALDAVAWDAVAAWRDPVNDPSDAIAALVSRAEPPRFDAIMALANAALRDGHPLKLTREDVLAVQQAVVAARLSASQPTLPDDVREQALRRAARLAAVAAKVDALLPPRSDDAG